ncbi:hypothetical protein PBF_08163 [Cytobacillus firmus DS1]|uniref:Uncharacterized protein n=1 Tax=Cytobacillus firmus DS1 TaxID=1307436 RepID=W7L8G9_CYTFI|nr:hypothetical protein PBF_08163 [Cytobacillus firmus DS1]
MMLLKPVNMQAFLFCQLFIARSDFRLKISSFLPIIGKEIYDNMEVYLEKTTTLPADVQLAFGSLLCF